MEITPKFDLGKERIGTLTEDSTHEVPEYFVRIRPRAVTAEQIAERRLRIHCFNVAPLNTIVRHPISGKPLSYHTDGSPVRKRRMRADDYWASGGFRWDRNSAIAASKVPTAKERKRLELQAKQARVAAALELQEALKAKAR